MTAAGRFLTFVLSVVSVVSVVLVVSVVGWVLGAPPVQVRPYDVLTVGAPISRIAVVGDSYTNGTAIGGQGANAWPTRAWKTLDRQGLHVVADVAAEGRAGYGVRGDQGNLFGDLTARAVKPDDTLVVFYGSRNDQGVDPNALNGEVSGALSLAHGIAPAAKLLVIGPPWPTADVPAGVLQVRDILSLQSLLAGATFFDPIAAGWFVDRPDLIGLDGVHPTNAGHVYMADKIAPLIGAQLPHRG